MSTDLRRLCAAMVLLVTMLLLPDAARGQAVSEARYSAMIELPKAYVSGVCIVQTRNDTVTGCLFNEFGISAIEFVRHPGKKKVKLLSTIKMLDKWYIRRVISRDLACLLDRMQPDGATYRNERRKITYTLTTLNDDATEE